MSLVLDKTTLAPLVGEPLISMTVKAGSKKGDNVAGSLKSVKVHTVSGKVHSLMVKIHPDDNPGILSYLINCRVMEAENSFYNYVLPALRQIILESRNKQLAANKKIVDIDLPFPHYYGGSDLFLALEDLGPQKFRMADKFKGLSLPETSLVLKKLASYHALSYCLIQEEGEKFFRKNYDLASFYLKFPWHDPIVPLETRVKLVDMFTDTISIIRDIDEELGAKMATLVPKFEQLLRGIYDQTDVKYFPVINLGDVWVNNILFKYDESNGENEVIDVKFIDLQQAHRGNIFEDLMYFFMTSTTPQFRQKNLASVLHIYFQEFVSTLKTVQCPLPMGFSLGFLIDNYYQNLINIAVFVGGAIGFQLGGAEATTEEENKNPKEEKEEKVEEDGILLKKYKKEDLVTLDDHFNSVGAFVRMNLLASPRAIERFRSVMTEFDELGVFS